MSSMYLKLLGVVQVSWEKGTPPRFRSQRTVALLGYLVAEQRPLTREFLSALFWPDEDPAKGKANLRRELHNLAQILPGCWQTSRAEVQFMPGAGVVVDIYQFLTYEKAQQWQEAANLICGNFLEGISFTDNLEFESWLLGEQEYWRQKMVAVLTKVIDNHIQRGANKRALENAHKLLQITPWDEAAHRRVILLLARTGQRSAALKQYIHCQEILADELGIEVSAETKALYDRIRRSQTFALHNIPAATTPLIGREQKRAMLESWLDNPHIRLITIFGAGGMGKTRLSLSLARSEAQAWENPASGKVRFPDGIYFIPMAALNDVEQMVTAVANALHFSNQGRDRRTSQQQLLDYLHNKQLLLILDNLEQLQAEVGFLTSILEAAPKVQIVATSRARLQLRGEQVLTLGGLDYLAQENSSAGRLFLRTAQRIQPDFHYSVENASALNYICRLVEGMPLALELAASWSDVLSITAIAQEIKRSLDFLETNAHDLPERHRSIRAVFDSSWQRLSSQDQSIYAQLSIFVGGFTREAAEAVCNASLRLLRRLVSQSLLQYDADNGRYQLHELLRQNAAEKLVNDQNVEIRQRHLAYFAQLAQKEKAKFNTIAYQANLNKWVAELGNIMSALNWSLEDHPSSLDGLKLAGALEDFWLGSGFVRQAHDCLVTLFGFETTDAPMKPQAIALRTLGRLKFLLTGNDESAITLCQESMALQEKSGDDRERIRTLCSLGQIERQRFKLKEAEDYYQQALDSSNELNDLWGKSTALHGLGALKLQQRDFRNALAFAAEGLSIAKQLGSNERSAHLLTLLGMVAIEQQDWYKAYSLTEKALKLYQHIGHRNGEKNALTSLGEIARIEGDYLKAAQLYQDSLIIARDQGTPWAISIELFNLGQTAILMDETGQAFAYLKEGFLLASQHSDPILIQTFIEGFANLAAYRNQSQCAAVLWGAAEAAREKSNDVFDIADQLQHDHFLARASLDMDEITFKHSWRKGRQMTLEQAVELALTIFK
ncbi:MAG: tetratricopeptide repeat protein [Anaerolineales bacterium]|nr:tetratricopeptide repeat protein [Anaerolineales bacterium]